MEFTYPVNISFTCNRCSLCCGDTKQKTRHILILETEAKKIALQTCQSTVEFSVQVNNKSPYEFEMKKTSDGKCVFLEENQCKIYSLRPLICMFYPFELKFDSDNQLHVFDFTLECPAIGHGNGFFEKDFEKLFDLAKERLLRAAEEHQPAPK